MISDPVKSRLKSVDPDRYRAALLADGTARENLWLLYAFHYELAKIPELVSEPMVGQIRYQWWRDAIEEIYSGQIVRSHEIATPLAKLLIEKDVPRFWIDQLIDGRERDLDPQPFADMDAAKSYGRQTSGILSQIAVKILDVDPNAAVVTAGEAWGLTGLARAWRFYKGTMLSNLDYQGLLDCAQSSYVGACDGLSSVPNSAFPALAYCALVPKYLAQMGKPGFDPELSTPQISPLLKQWHLLMAVLRGRV